MPKFLEEQLRASAAKQGLTGDRADAYTYGAMNNLGAMRGNQETAKGRRMERQHDAAEAKSGTSERFNPAKNLGKYHHPPKGRR